MISIFFAVSSLVAQPQGEEDLITDNSAVEEIQEIVLEDEEDGAFKDEDEG